MVIRVRTTKRRLYDKSGNELAGYCAMPTPQRMVVQIARRHNKTFNVYAGTLLHELIHVWINCLKVKGFNPDDETEEKFVSAVEQIVVRTFFKSFSRRKTK